MLGVLSGLTGECLRLWALGYTGEPTRKQELDAPILVTAGPFSIIRNPLYAGNILNGLGVSIAASGGYSLVTGAALNLATLAFLAIIYGNIIVLEERYLEAKFGETYLYYKNRVPALLPRRLKPSSGEGDFDLNRALYYEQSSLIWWISIWSYLLLKATGALYETLD